MKFKFLTLLIALSSIRASYSQTYNLLHYNSVKVSQATVIQGNAFTISFIIANEGTDPTPLQKVSLYLSKDDKLDNTDVLISTSKAQSISNLYSTSYIYSTEKVPCGTLPGTYSILVKADAANEVAETKEDDNIKASNYFDVVVPPILPVASVPKCETAVITTCDTTIYDNGGTGNYQNNSIGSLTLFPTSIDKKIKITFTEFSLSTVAFDSDFLYVLNDNTVLSKLNGNKLPPSYVSTNGSGSLTLKLETNQSSVGAGFVVKVTCDVANGLEEVSNLNSVNIYPIPASENVKIDLEETANIKIYDSEGKLKYSGSENIISLETFATGLYQVIISGKNTYHRTLSVVK